MSREPYDDGVRTGWVEEGRIHVETEKCEYRPESDAWKVHPYGGLTSLEIPFPHPVPNMDASDPLLVSVEIRTFRGQPIHVGSVIAHVCDPEDLEIVIS